MTLLLALGVAACSGPVSPPVSGPAGRLEPAAFDGARALDEVRRFLEVGPRDSGTPGAALAADYLARRLGELGLPAVIEAFTNDTPRGPVIFRNVVATRPGADPAWVVLGAHYDTKSGIPGFQGANDSGSGVGALLEIARGLAVATNLPASVQLVFFDGEECMVEYGPNDGLHGSRHHAARLVREGVAPKVRGMILLDMIGDRNLSVTLALNNSMPLVSAVLTAAHAENARERFSLLPMNILDDHVPFLEAGMPAVDMIDFQYGDSPGSNEHWHTATDTIDKLSADSLRIAGRVALRVVNELLAGAAVP